MRILVVEDSERLRNSVAAALKHSGYAVDATGDGSDGLWRAKSGEHDLLVLDLMLPGLSGLDILRRLRAEGRRVPVLLLTARDAVDDRVRGLDAGADDYLVKPFALEELLARVRALVRRAADVPDPVMTFGDLRIDTVAKTVRRGGGAVDLAPREHALLEFLAHHAGECLSRTRIEAAIYDDAAGPMSNVVDAAVCALRRKIDPPGGPSYVRTRRGLGYVFAPDLAGGA